jgi:peptidoglycan endopeptidase LytE
MRLAAYFFVFSLFASGLKIAEARDLNPTLISPNIFIEYSPIYTNEIESSLNVAISDRLGLPYRWAGTDDNGYDCSGFVWRVFREAGIDFDRTSTRILWQRLPEATQEEYARFGTLVFFGGPQGLDHVGIVRDAQSFYHASNSQGVTMSLFDSFDKYWRNRIIGYRRIFAPIRRRAAPGRR